MVLLTIIQHTVVDNSAKWYIHLARWLDGDRAMSLLQTIRWFHILVAPSTHFLVVELSFELQSRYKNKKFNNHTFKTIIHHKIGLGGNNTIM